MKKYFNFLFILALVSFISMPFINVKAVSYDDTLEQVTGIKVEEDGTISWTRSLYAYGIWVEDDLNETYKTALVNEVTPDEPSINLIDLIEEKCPNSSYGWYPAAKYYNPITADMTFTAEWVKIFDILNGK